MVKIMDEERLADILLIFMNEELMPGKLNRFTTIYKRHKKLPLETKRNKSFASKFVENLPETEFSVDGSNIDELPNLIKQSTQYTAGLEFKRHYRFLPLAYACKIYEERYDCGNQAARWWIKNVLLKNGLAELVLFERLGKGEKVLRLLHDSESIHKYIDLFKKVGKLEEFVYTDYYNENQTRIYDAIKKDFNDKFDVMLKDEDIRVELLKLVNRALIHDRKLFIQMLNDDFDFSAFKKLNNSGAYLAISLLKIHGEMGRFLRHEVPLMDVIETAVRSSDSFKKELDAYNAWIVSNEMEDKTEAEKAKPKKGL